MWVVLMGVLFDRIEAARCPGLPLPAELKFSVRDLLAERVYYKQFANVKYADGRKAEKEEVARCYRPGRNIGISVICNL